MYSPKTRFAQPVFPKCENLDIYGFFQSHVYLGTACQNLTLEGKHENAKIEIFAANFSFFNQSTFHKYKLVKVKILMI